MMKEPPAVAVSAISFGSQVKQSFWQLGAKKGLTL